ncbi:MAG TPA: putative Ig domain-containing protein [Streptosporangiaceae bacterium]|nr:putative Ig domain-containing protein [Streptosporangiaceae bacterium]
MALVLLGLWGGLVPFAGPYFGYAYTPARAWTYTPGRLWLEVLPAAGVVVSGVMVLATRSRLIALAGGVLGAVGATWFIVGRAVSELWNVHGASAAGLPAGAPQVRVLEQIGFFDGLGVACLFLAAFALGRFLVVGVRDVKDLSRRWESAGASHVPAGSAAVPASEPMAMMSGPSLKARLGTRSSRPLIRAVPNAVLLSAIAVLAAASVTVTAWNVGWIGPPLKPRFTSPARAGFVAGSDGRFAITTANFSGRLTERGVLPAGLVFQRAASGAAAISGVPSAGSGGAYSVSVTAASPAGRPVSQTLTIVVDEVPRLIASKTSQWGIVFDHMTFRITVLGYPVPRIALVGKLPAGLVLKVYGRIATISGKIHLSWLKTLEAGAAIVFAVLTGGSSIVGLLGTAADVGNVGYGTLYSALSITVVASNSSGITKLPLTLRILGPI